MHRRQFISGLLVGLAAPAIVRYASLMPVHTVSFGMRSWAEFNENYWVLHPEQYQELLRYHRNAISASPLIDEDGYLREYQYGTKLIHATQVLPC